MIIDTHSHIFKEYYKNVDEVINKMKNNIIIVCGTNYNNNKEVIKLCNKYNNVYGTLGFHPNELEDFEYEHIKIIEENINNPKIVGIGEIGLDYHWNDNNKDFQKEIFEKQLDLAKKYKKTVVIHSRDAFEDTYNILSSNKYRNLKVILHCYSYDLEKAQKFINLGIMLGISGIVTFTSAKQLREVVKKIDLKHLLIETDSPYLAPVPFRGKKNEPLYVKLVAQKIAEIKNISVEDVYLATTSNAIHKFDLKIDL